jgi:DNA helicase HerA-like ATPase
VEIKTTDVILILGQRGTGKSNLVKYLAKRFKRIVVYDCLHEHSELGAVTHNIEDINNENLELNEKIIFQPYEDSQELFNEFCNRVWKMQNVVCIIEEISNYASNNYLDLNFSKLLRLGRHRGIGLICISQRCALVNKTIPALAEHIISFRQQLPNDLAYLYEFVGQDVYKLPSLENFYFMHYSYKTGVTFYKPIS